MDLHNIVIVLCSSLVKRFYSEEVLSVFSPFVS